MNKLKKVALTLAVSTFIITSYNAAFASTGTVTANTVRIRSEANTESEIIDRSSNGETVEVIEQTGDWYKVNYKGKEGYIYKDYLKVQEDVKSSETLDAPLNTSDSETLDALMNTENSETTSETAETVQNSDSNESETKETAPNDNEKILELSDTINKTTDTYLLPNFTSTKISKLDQGTKITLIKAMANWAKVELNGQSFWIPKGVLMQEITETEKNEEREEKTEQTETEKPEEKPVEEQKETKEEPAKVAIEPTAAYISSNASSNLRKGPSTETESLGKLARHTKITIIGEEGDWYKVTYNGKEGYVSKSLVTKGEPPAETSSRSKEEPRTSPTTEKTVQTAPVAQSGSASSAVGIAEQYLGCKYVSGGTSPSTGFDCSGFTQYVYKQCGISISRTSYTQANDGTAVSKSDLQPGDLLLFRSNGSSSIGHVGIYAGNGKFIHAANSNRGVVCDTINSGYYQNNYAGARRL